MSDYRQQISEKADTQKYPHFRRAQLDFRGGRIAKNWRTTFRRSLAACVTFALLCCTMPLNVFAESCDHTYNIGYYSDNGGDTHSPKCDKCSYVDTEPTKAETHTYDNCLFTKSDGYYYKKCDKCDHTDTTAWVPYTDSATNITYILHNFGEDNKQAWVLDGHSATGNEQGKLILADIEITDSNRPTDLTSSDNGTYKLVGLACIADMGAFEYVSNITEIDLSACTSLKYIGKYAFYSCGTLASIYLSRCTSLTNIGDYAFYSCGTLASIYLSGCTSLTNIGDYAFYNCSDLTLVNLSGCTNLTTIGRSAFSYCNALDSIDLSECTSLTTIGNYAFYNCYNDASLTGLTTIKLPASVTSIGDYAFTYCKALTSITIPASVTSIGDYAFEDCSELTTLTIFGPLNKNLTIGKNAFQYCTAIKNVFVPSKAALKKFNNNSDDEQYKGYSGLKVTNNGDGSYSFESIEWSEPA